MDRYYKTDIRRLPWQLVWSWGNPVSFIAFAVRKVLPIPFYGPTLVPEQSSVVPVAEDTFNRELRLAMLEHVEQAVALGFEEVVLYSVATLGPSRGLGRAFLAPDRRSICLIVSAAIGAIWEAHVVLISEDHDSHLLGTPQLFYVSRPFQALRWCAFRALTRTR